MSTVLDTPLFAAAAELGNIILPVGSGLVAVYLLLPRVRRYPPLWGGALGGIALLLAGWLVVHVGMLSAEALLFYAFSAIAVVAGTLLVTQSNPVHAALSFALVVLSTCGLFLLLAAPFLMAATTIIYAGAIIVTFLFVIMLAQQAGQSDADQRSREPLLSTVAGFVLLGALLFVLKLSYETSELDRLTLRSEEIAGQLDPSQPNVSTVMRESLRQLAKDANAEAPRWSGSADGKELADKAADAASARNPAAAREELEQFAAVAKRLRHRPGFLQPPAAAALSSFSGPRPNLPEVEQRRAEDGRPPMPAENLAYLGRSLLTDYLLAVELGGTLLLVATIGAIVIASRRAERTS